MPLYPVSYTHLDVYKRQAWSTVQFTFKLPHTDYYVEVYSYVLFAELRFQNVFFVEQRKSLLTDTLLLRGLQRPF